ncbi:uncharacterized protein LOC144452682 [Glandiceps talaboti]
MALLSAVLRFLILLSVIDTAKCTWPNTCTYRRQITQTTIRYLQTSYISRYLTGCALWQCSHYRTAYRSTPYYDQKYVYSYYSGECIGYCSNHECDDCNAVDNCADTRCSTNNDQFCLKCDYDRGGYKKAYELVEFNGIQNRVCEQRCSWRPDSDFCYPGTCPGRPSTCTCLSGFGGNNCLTISEGPPIYECIVTTDVTCDIECNKEGSNFCRMPSKEFEVDWTSSFVPMIESISTPYYVNEARYGIVQATLTWQIVRDGTTIKTESSDCLPKATNIVEIAVDDLPIRSCNHLNTIDTDTGIQHGDILSFTVLAQNGGFIRLNNFDDEDIVRTEDPKFYIGRATAQTTIIEFDFRAPIHCIDTLQTCNDILDIGNPYTRERVMTIRWRPQDWQDSPSGIDHYDCEVFLLTLNPSKGNLLDFKVDAPHAAEREMDPSVDHTMLSLPETGVFAVLLTVVDVAGNIAKSRRFLVFDDESSIDVDKQSPIVPQGGVFNSDVHWVTRSEGEVTITWKDHFYNSFYEDDHLLNAIAPMDPDIGTHDEMTGQPPLSRSRELIANANGIIRFSFAYVLSTSGKNEPDNWSNTSGVETSHTISLSGDNEYIKVWVIAFDVIGNSQQDTTTFYIDTSLPTISEMSIVTENGTSRRKREEAEARGISLQAYDDESGILEIRLQLVDKVDTSKIYGESVLSETSNGNGGRECMTLSCNCPKNLDTCFFIDYIVYIEKSSLVDLPEGRVECLAKITVVNNAMLESSDDVEVWLEVSQVKSAYSKSSQTPAIAGSSSGIFVVIIVIIVIVVVIIYRRRGSKRGRRGQNESFGNLYYDNTTCDVEIKEGESTGTGTRRSLAKKDIELSASQIKIKELLRPGIHKGELIKTSKIPGDTLVAVKSLKDPSNAAQRKHLLHELDIMLSMAAHDNAIRLIGCITQPGALQPSIILEFAPYGNLAEVLRQSKRKTVIAEPPADDDDIYQYCDITNSKNTLNSDQLMTFAEQIVTGMEYLAGLNIVHRKLGARNVFVGTDRVCKIASFSQAVALNDGKAVKEKLQGRLPIRWMAPESLKSDEFSFKTDVWTYGIVLWEIVTLGASPYPGLPNNEISGRIRDGEQMDKPSHCTEELYAVMQRCWNMKPGRRPSFAELLLEMKRLIGKEDVMDFDQFDGDLYGEVGDL